MKLFVLLTASPGSGDARNARRRLAVPSLTRLWSVQSGGGHVLADHAAPEQGRWRGRVTRQLATTAASRGDPGAGPGPRAARTPSSGRLVRLVGSINRYLGLRRPCMPAAAAALVGDRSLSPGRDLWAPRTRRRAVAPARGRHRPATRAGHAGPPLTWSGCCSRWSRTGDRPGSELAAAERASYDVAIQGLAGDGRRPGRTADGPARGGRRAGQGAGGWRSSPSRTVQPRGRTGRFSILRLMLIRLTPLVSTPWAARISLPRSSSSSVASRTSGLVVSTCSSPAGPTVSCVLGAGRGRRPSCRGGCCGSAVPAAIRRR